MGNSLLKIKKKLILLDKLANLFYYGDFFSFEFEQNFYIFRLLSLRETEKIYNFDQIVKRV